MFKTESGRDITYLGEELGNVIKKWSLYRFNKRPI